MAKAELKTKQKTEVEDSSSLKGTLASVFFFGSVYYCHLGKCLLPVC